MMKKFKALFFDLDDTLCDWQGAKLYGIEAAYKLVTRRYPEITIERWRTEFDHVSIQMFSEWSKFTRPSSELRLERTRRIFARLGINGQEILADSVTEAFFAHALKNLRLFDEVNEVLLALRPHFILGLITNTLADVQRVKIHKLGLDEKIHHVLIASEVGISKPSPEIFHRALELVKVNAEEFLFVGNSLEDDVAGARAAGVSVAWLNRPGASLPDGIQPTFVMHTLRDLLVITSKA